MVPKRFFVDDVIDDLGAKSTTRIFLAEQQIREKLRLGKQKQSQRDRHCSGKCSTRIY